MSNPFLAGSGGGKGTGSVRYPQELDDTLRSRASVRCVDVLMEGEIDGICDVEGTVLEDAILGAVTRGTAGEILSVAVTYGGRGYNPGARITFSGSAYTAPAYAIPVVENGVIIGVSITQRGKGYTSNVVATVSPVIGRGVYLDGVVAQNPDQTYNFEDLQMQFRSGTQGQTALQDFPSAENTTYLNQVAKTTAPVNFQVFDVNADYINVGLGVSGLFSTDKATGDTVGSEVAWQILVTYKNNKRSYAQQLAASGTIRGKTRSAYVTQRQIILQKDVDAEAHEWSFTLQRLTADANSQSDQVVVNELALSYVSVISNSPFRYPNTALVGLKVNAEQFSRIPSRAYDVRMTKIRVPNNYNAETRTYDRNPLTGATAKTSFSAWGEVIRAGVFRVYCVDHNIPADADGSVVSYAEIRNASVAALNTAQAEVMFTAKAFNDQTQAKGFFDIAVPDVASLAVGTKVYDFKVNVTIPWNGDFQPPVWCNNPAWCLYDIVTNDRYGLGSLIPTELADKWGLYKIAQECDVLVSDGYGGLEPQFSCDMLLQSREEAFKVISDMCAVFRGVLCWTNGLLSPVADFFQSPRWHLSNADVIGGNFSYSGTAKSARHTVCTVHYINPILGYKPDSVTVSNTDAVNKYGVRETSISVPCASRGQAIRAGRALLFSELLQTELVTFTTGLRGMAMKIGDIISVADSLRSGVQFGGRIAGISEDRMSVTLDRNANPPTGEYTFMAHSPQEVAKTVDSSEDIDAYVASQLFKCKVRSFTLDEALDKTTVFLELPLPSSVALGASFGLMSDEVEPQLFQIMALENPEPHLIGVTALEYSPEKYAYIIDDIPPEEASISALAETVAAVSAPRNLTATAETSRQDLFIVNLSWLPPQRGLASSYKVYVRRESGNFQEYATTAGTSVDVTLNFAGLYSFAVASVGLNGVQSVTAIAVLKVGRVLPSTNRDRITGLQLLNGANSTTVNFADIELSWRINSVSNSYEAFFARETNGDTTEPNTSGANLGGITSGSSYQISVYDAAFNLLRTLNNGTSNTYTLTASSNAQLTGGPYRDLIFEVRVVSSDGIRSDAEYMSVYNPALSVPTGVIVARTESGVDVTFPHASRDFDHYVVAYSMTAGFVPDTATKVTCANSGTAQIAVASTVYLRYAAIDSFDEEHGLTTNWSDEQKI